MTVRASCIRGAARGADGNDRQHERGRIGQHVRRLCQQRDGVRQVAADRYHQREGRENDERRDEALPAVLVVVAAAVSGVCVVRMSGVMGLAVKIVRHVCLPVVNLMSP
jgi:hypothetical protein